MSTVESHAHLYAADDSLYPPGTDTPHRPPAGTGTIEHLEGMRQENGITHVVAVQTHSFYRHDNRLMADTVAAHRDWMTGVCNLPSDGPDSPDELERLSAGGVRGLRLEFPTLNPGPFYHPGSVALCARAHDLGLVINIHANGTDYFSDAARLLQEFPQLPFCLDHCGYVRPEVPEILGQVLALAEHPNLHMKMSFWSERDDWSIKTGRIILDTYGPQRCMWGGNYPAELWHPKLSYADHLAVLRDDICTTETERQAVLSQTPLRVWFPDHN
jgi:predicted TIM-barrel fold metal-dependent hydrolase